MKAIVCEKFGLPETLKLMDLKEQSVGENEVIISVKACGVNFPDTLIIQNLYQFKPDLPFSPGGEVAGIIKKLGRKVKNFTVGDRVFALCGWGGFAEELKVEAKKVIPMLEAMDFVSAAALTYNYGTSYYALKNRAKLQKNETVLVLGAAGGVGIAAVELAKVMGATVIAAASTEEKLSFCRLKGADFTINYEKEDLKTRVKELTEGIGVDVVYDPVGSKWTEPALRTMAWNGRYLCVGFAGGQIPKIPLNLALLKGCAILGVFLGKFASTEPAASFQNMKELGNLFLKGKIKPLINKCYKLAEAPMALNDLINRKVIGKAVVVTVSIEEATKTEVIIQKPNQGKFDIERPQVFNSKQEVFDAKSKILGHSKWLKITQEMIKQFAKTTFDEQWIHTDVEKAKASPFGRTVAHGFLTLSLIPKMAREIYTAPFSKMGINYGSEKVRFIHVVPEGSEIRMKAKLKHVSAVANEGLKMIVEATIEIKGIEKPACYAEIITVLY